MCRKLPYLVSCVAVLVLVGACGVPTDDGPRPLAESEIPGGPLSPETTTTTVVDSPGVNSELWFVRDQEDLQASVATLSSRQPDTVLTALVSTM